MTSIETGPSWVERLNPRHWTLVWKLVIVGLVPALLALALGALRIADQAGSAADLGRSGKLLELHTQVASAGDALRQERDAATLYVASNRNGDRRQLTTADTHSDDLLGAMRTGIQSTGNLDQASAVAVAQANGVLGQLPALRRDVTDNTVALPAVRDRYSRVIEGVDVLDRAVLRSVRVPETAGQIDALTALQNVEAQLAVQHTVLGDAIRAGKLQDGDANAASSADVQIFAQYRAYQVALTPDQLERYGSFLDDPSNAERQRLTIAILTSAGKPDLGGVTAADWDNANKNAKAVADRSANLIRDDLVASSNAAAQRASNLAGINSVVLMLGLLIGITIAVLVARSLIRSLRVLRSSALDVAERRLPQAVESMRAGEAPDVVVEPVPIRTRDEVGQVARAFDAVHGQAVRLAADQAMLQANVSAMFVNLSRRSQALVERQLQLIEALESNEQDADQLSNLFQLDHLATRMRRNSENLLVLAGTDLAKRNIAPVPMVDVLRAAVSEVESYQRVVVQAPPAASVAGRAGSDLVHLLAELLDNATAFSPPESQVVMSATRTPDGSMAIEISDRGVGMADHELEDANQRLNGPSSVDVSASRRMGLFVVGRLAARHGIGVRLNSAAAGPGTGLTASVTVPASLIPTGIPAEPARPVGVPMTAGVPRQGGQPGEQRPQRADPNGIRPNSLSALVAGTDGPASAASGAQNLPAGGGQGTLFAGRPMVNGTTTHGLPTRKPGSSLRPDGPPPTDVPPGGFFDDANIPEDHEDHENREEGPRPPAEQARLDQEAAARRDRLAGTSGVSGAPPFGGPRPPSDERSVSDDERTTRQGDGPSPGPGRPRPVKDLAGPGSTPPSERPFGGSRPSESGTEGGPWTTAPRGFPGAPAQGGPARGGSLPPFPGAPDPAGRRASGPSAPEGAGAAPKDTPWGADTSTGRDADGRSRPADAETAATGPEGPNGDGATAIIGRPDSSEDGSDLIPDVLDDDTGDPSAAGERADAANGVANLTGSGPRDAEPSEPSDSGGLTPPNGGRSFGRPGAGPGALPVRGERATEPTSPAAGGPGGLPVRGPRSSEPTSPAGSGPGGLPVRSPRATGPTGPAVPTGDTPFPQPGTLPVSGERNTGPGGPADGAPAPGTLPVRGSRPYPGGGIPNAAPFSSDEDAEPMSGPSERPGALWEPPQPDPSNSGQFRNDQYRGDQYRGDQYRNEQYRGDQYRSDQYRSDHYRSDQYRSDRQGRGPQYDPYRSVSGTGGFPQAGSRSGLGAMPPGRPMPGEQQPSGPAPLPAMAPPPADRPADELFAPRVPSLDPEGQLPGHDPAASAFDLGETTPIFEEIASAWFRSNRPVPVSWESDTGSHAVVPPGLPDDTDPAGVAQAGEERSPAAPAAPAAESRPAVGTPADGWPAVERPAAGPADILADAGADAPPSAAPDASAPLVPSARSAPDNPFGENPYNDNRTAENRTTENAYSDDPYNDNSYSENPYSEDPHESGTHQVPEPAADFSTAADEGWLAASGAAAERPDELTAAGLPKRRPRARLIPGSAGSAVLAPAVTSARSAETIRGRLASYQQGVRQGRETRLRHPGSADTPASPAAADVDHDEESS